VYGEYNDGGAFAPYVTQRRFGASPVVSMMELAQPRGDFSDPPLPYLLVIQMISPALNVTWDCGFGTSTMVVRRGEFAVQFPDTATPIVLDQPNQFRMAVIARDGLDRLLRDSQPDWLERIRKPQVTCFRDAGLGRSMTRMWDEADTGGAAARVLVEGAALALLGGLLRQAGTPAARPPAGLAPWQVRRTQAYMLDNLDAEVGLAELAALVGLSPSHYCTAFRHSTGLPPHAWLAQARIERAKGLLADPKLSLTEIAQTVGYTGQSAFGAAFRRATGATPSAFRRDRLA
jgi:AraC family transcriptional regulator